MKNTTKRLVDHEADKKLFKKWLHQNYDYVTSDAALTLLHESYLSNEPFHFSLWNEGAGEDRTNLFLKLDFDSSERIKVLYQITNTALKVSSWKPLPLFASPEEESENFHVSSWVRTNLRAA